MAGYTKLNLKQDVEDQAPHYDMSPQLEFRVAREPLETENAAISYLRVAPNFRLPFGHTHGEQEEVYVLVGGSARIKLDTLRQRRAKALTETQKFFAALDLDLDRTHTLRDDVDRLAMLKYGMDDLRAFFDGDLRWMKHYGFRFLDVPTLSGGVGA